MRSRKHCVPVAAGIGIAAVVLTVWAGGQAAVRHTDQDRLERSEERSVAATAAWEANREQALNAHANLPLTFVENRGQTDRRVRYYAQGARYAFYFTREAVVFSFRKGADAPDSLGRSDGSSLSRVSTLGARAAGLPAGRATAAEEKPTHQGVALALRFLGANPQVVVEGEERAPGEVNYFLGKAPTGWRTHLPHYAQIVYRELWPGVDLRLREQNKALK